MTDTFQRSGDRVGKPACGVRRRAGGRRARLHATTNARGRKLTVEALEPRCLLAADLLSHDALVWNPSSGNLPSWVPAEEMAAGDSGHPVTVSAGDQSPVRLQVRPLESGAGRELIVGQEILLQIHFVLGSEMPLNGTIGMRIAVHYDPRMLVPSGPVSATGDDWVPGEWDPDTDDLNFRMLRVGSAEPMAVSLQIPFQIVGTGSSIVTGSLTPEVDERVVGSWDAYADSTMVVATAGPGQVGPARDDLFVEGFGPIPPGLAPRRDDPSSSAGLLPTRALTPKTSVTSSLSEAFVISLVFDEAPDAEESLQRKVTLRVRVPRTSWAWSLDEEATANLLRPLLLADSASMTHSPSTVATSLLAPRPVVVERREVRDRRHSEIVPPPAAVPSFDRSDAANAEPAEDELPAPGEIRMMTPADVDAALSGWHPHGLPEDSQP